MSEEGNAVVSVCVPVYNGARFLDGCLDGIRRQTARELEILVIDDGSVDDSPAIAARHARQDPRVRLVRNPVNLGLVGNWNACLAQARGDWIKFVFQDDEIEPDCVARLLAAGQAGAPFVACERRYEFDPDVDAGTRRFYDTLPRFGTAFPGRDRVSAGEFCDGLIDFLGYNIVGEPTSVMFRRALVDQLGTFNEHLVSVCDLEFWARLGAHHGLHCLPQALVKFRVHADAASARNNERRFFRMTELDQVVLLHEYAFAPVFAPLRAAAARRAPPVDVAALFERRLRRSRRCYYAGARWERDGDLRREWTEVAGLYPRIARDQGGLDDTVDRLHGMARRVLRAVRGTHGV